MSLSEQDRVILLQEIQQIQRTLEATGRTFVAEENNFDSSDDDGAGETDLYKFKQEEESDEDEDDDIHSSQSVHSASIYNEYSHTYSYNADNVDGALAPTSPGFLENDSVVEVATNDGELSLDVPESAMSQTSSTKHSAKSGEKSSEIVKPKSSISSKLKKRIKHESEFGTKSTSETSKSKSKSKSKNASSRASGESLPTKQIEKINMANLYVERLFGAFRNKKSKPSHLIAVGDEKYGSKDLKSSANLGTLENLLQVNRRYKDLLEDELKKVELAIARNGRAQQEVACIIDEKNVIHQTATFTGLSKACIGRFGNPYFKDNEGMGPPDNEDATEKKRTVKVDPFHRGSKPWKNTEADALEDGVYHNNLEKRLEPYMKRLKQFDKGYKDKQKMGIQMDKTVRHEVTKEIACIKELPREELMMDPSQIDFFRISKNFLPTRDEFECRVQWCNVAHPSINQTSFTKDEDGMLIKLAKKYKNYQWESIAKELGTNRTPIQCLQRYQRTLNKEMIKTVWEEEDDNKLRIAVSLHGTHNWVMVAAALGNRTGDQCMHRWQKTLDPTIKRGKWSNEEDQILLKAVEKYGTKNWREAQKDVPGRTDAQCRERYVSTLDPTKDWGAFSEEEDKKIIELVRKYGVGKWSTIAKEFPNRRDNQIWRRYTQIESENYHKYRRGVIWKRRSVMNYFFHRQSERRDYSLDELDVNYSPSLTHMESRKLERTREELDKCGYSDDEITKKLARMHYEGHFSKSIYKPRQRPFSQGRPKRLNLSRKSNAGKLASKKLLADVRNVLCNVKDPTAELPPPPVEPLRRKTKVDREVNIDGYHRIPKPVLKKKGRKETWLEKKVNADIFRRKCYEVIMKLKLKAIWFDDARNTLDNYYAMVQVPGNQTHFHKQILHVYTDILVRYQNMFSEHKDVEKMLLTDNEIPVVIVKPEFNNKPAKKKKQIRYRKPRKVKKVTTFKEMVLDADNGYDTSFDDDRVCEQDEISRLQSDVRNIKNENINPPINIPQYNYIKYRPQFTNSHTQSHAPVSQEADLTDPEITSSGIEYSVATPSASTALQDSYSENDTHGIEENYNDDVNDTEYKDHNPVSPAHENENYTPSEINKIRSIPSIPYSPLETISGSPDSHLASSQNVIQDNDIQTPNPATSLDLSTNKHLKVEEVDSVGSGPLDKKQKIIIDNHTSSSTATEKLPAIIDIPTVDTEKATTQEETSIPNIQQPAQLNIQQPAQLNIQQPAQFNLPKQIQNATAQQSQVNMGQEADQQSPFHADKVNTFKLLLQALYVDTDGVMSTLKGTPSTNPLPTLQFPTCYPLSPNSASLLGFRRLLLHRRVLGEIVKEHTMNSERLGIPVVHDKSYQNTKSYDALRKRFRSIFTWPAFLATFIPKYIEEPLNTSEQLSMSKSSLSSAKNSTSAKNSRKRVEKKTSSHSSSTRLASSSTEIDNTPIRPLTTISYKGNENNARGNAKVLLTDVLGKKFTGSDYIEEMKRDREKERTKLINKTVKQSDYSTSHLRKRKNNVLNVTITSPFKKHCREQATSEHNHRETIIIADDKPVVKCRIKNHISKRKSQSEDYHYYSVTNPVKKRKGKKRIDARQSNLETIFIPPAIKVEEVEENLCTEIVDNSESPQIIT